MRKLRIFLPHLSQKLVKKNHLYCTKPTSGYTVDGRKVPDVHRRLICLKVSVSGNLSQRIIPSDEDFSCLYPTFTPEVITFRWKRTDKREDKTIYFRCQFFQQCRRYLFSRLFTKITTNNCLPLTNHLNQILPPLKKFLAGVFQPMRPAYFQ